MSSPVDIEPRRPLGLILALPMAALAYLPQYAELTQPGRHALFVLLPAAALWGSGALPPFAVSLLVIALQVALLGDPAGAFAAGDPRRWEMFAAVPKTSALGATTGWAARVG